MKIPGWMYLIVGGFVVGFTWYVTSVKQAVEPGQFVFFTWMGWLFIGVGFIKSLIAFMTRDRPAKAARQNFHHQNPHQMAQHQQHGQAHGHQPTPHIKYCLRCGTAVRSFDRFCFSCGSQHFRH